MGHVCSGLLRTLSRWLGVVLKNAGNGPRSLFITPDGARVLYQSANGDIRSISTNGNGVPHTILTPTKLASKNSRSSIALMNRSRRRVLNQSARLICGKGCLVIRRLVTGVMGFAVVT